MAIFLALCYSGSCEVGVAETLLPSTLIEEVTLKGDASLELLCYYLSGFAPFWACEVISGSCSSCFEASFFGCPRPYIGGMG